MSDATDKRIERLGVVCLNKPVGWSSNKAVTAIRTMLGGRRAGVKVGHAGTLDPLAGGVLVLLVGRATKLAELLMNAGKQYTTDIHLGATSTTEDLEGEITPTPGATPPDEAAVRETLKRFVGRISQRPPAHSAVHVDGTRAYKLARKGADLDLPPREVLVKSLELLRYEWPMLRLRVDCGRGTYIRSLARDIGETLGTGGYMQSLVRTRVGPLRLDCSVPPEECRDDNVEMWLRPVEWALTTTIRVDLDADTTRLLASGNAVDAPPGVAHLDTDRLNHPVAAYGPAGQVIALCSIHDAKLQPTQVFRPA